MQPASEPAGQSSAEAEALRKWLAAARVQPDGLPVPVLPLRQAAPDATAELGVLEQRRFAACQ